MSSITPIPVLNPELEGRYLSHEQIAADIEFFEKKLAATPESLRARVQMQLDTLKDAAAVYRFTRSELKTSEEWHRELTPAVTIMDPDGWDRRNWEYSFTIEKITKEEYYSRLNQSTVSTFIPGTFNADKTFTKL